MIPFARIVKYGNEVIWIEPGEQLFTSSGTFIVPLGITEISACVISPGNSSGAGGGLSWRSTIEVTPGDVLTITLMPPYTETSYAESGIYFNSVPLCVSTMGSGIYGGKGGKTANAINDGGGNGGNAGRSGGAWYGGGAGGYTGNGGNGDSIAPTAGTGGAGGGASGGGWPYTSGVGGGTGIIVQGASGEAGSPFIPYDGYAGSGGSGKNYGGGGSRWEGSSPAFISGGVGAIRIVWGSGRTYPDKSV